MVFTEEDKYLLKIDICLKAFLIFVHVSTVEHWGV